MSDRSRGKTAKKPRKTVDADVARTRTLVLRGKFSIEEIDASSPSRKKASKRTNKKASKKVGKKAGKKARKKTSTRKTGGKKVAAKKTSRKEAPGKEASSSAEETSQPKEEEASRSVSGNATVVLSGDEDIKNVADLRDRLNKALDSGSDIVIDAGKIESVDTAVLQLLAAFISTLQKNSRSFGWKDAPDKIKDLADLADLSNVLRFDAVSANDDDAEAASANDDDADDDALVPVF